ncbi:BPI fold-containing family C protein [Trachypithecus francoisi]|uniref:BPI fold-containing family C protein n=1 Tax=Trachypithecus francoisi TaxID=54180 RepID=UPI00141B7246|nr:BPI fold-containing family C protein [Trachypithecus francoisi]
MLSLSLTKLGEGILLLFGFFLLRLLFLNLPSFKLFLFSFRFRLALPESNRSNIEVLRFENILSSILHFGVLPLANAKLQQGFPLPNPHKISFVNSDIEVLQGFLLISTDLKYETSSKQQPSFHGWEGLNLISGQWRGKSAP